MGRSDDCTGNGARVACQIATACLVHAQEIGDRLEPLVGLCLIRHPRSDDDLSGELKDLWIASGLRGTCGGKGFAAVASALTN